MDGILWLTKSVVGSSEFNVLVVNFLYVLVSIILVHTMVIESRFWYRE